MSDYVGWLGNVFLVVGLLMAGRKWRHSFLLTFVGETIWAAESVRIGRVDMASLCVVFAVISVWNWFLWGRKE